MAVPHLLLIFRNIQMLTTTNLSNSPLGGVIPSDPETLLLLLYFSFPPLAARVPGAFYSQCSPGIVVFRSKSARIELDPVPKLRFPESLAAEGGRVR